MAILLKAVNAFRPKLKLGRTITTKEMVDYIMARTGLNKGAIQQVLAELADTVIFFNRNGVGVKLEGLGTYLPKIANDGKISVSHRLDSYIRNALNVKGSYTGEIINRKNIGKTKEDYIAMWNEAHPDDPINLN